MATRPLDPDACAELVTLRRWARKTTRDESGCVVWTACRTPTGYGKVSLDGRDTKAHRVALVAKLGRDLDPALVVNHICRNRACVNPDHLEEVTQLANIFDSPYFNQTHCKKGHLLGGANHRPSKDGRRRCAECWRESSREQANLIIAASRTLGLSYSEYVRQYGSSKRLARSLTNTS